MNHPEGRLLAIQQQMAFANLVTKGNFTAEVLLELISEAGLCLAPDINEIALDAAMLLPKINNPKSRLQAVKDEA
jgi:hypothetical protein